MSAYPVVSFSGVPFLALPASQSWWLTRPGVYLLCRRDWAGKRTILYIGKTEDELATRLGPSHERWAEALEIGMNEVLVFLLARTPYERLAVESYLRRRHPTPLNRQSPARRQTGLIGEARRALLVAALLDGLGPASRDADAPMLSQPR